MHERFFVTGSKEHLEQLVSTLRERRIEGIEVSDPHAAKGTLLSRVPLGQFGLFEVLISVAANLASSAVYDAVKQIIGQFSQDGKVKIVSAPKSFSKLKPNPGHCGAKKTNAKTKASVQRSKK